MRHALRIVRRLASRLLGFGPRGGYEPRQLQEALQAKVEELETLMDLLPVALFRAHDPEATRITANRAGAQLYETPPGENVSLGRVSVPEHRGPRRVYDGSGRELSSAELPMQRAMGEGREIRNEEIQVVLPSGRQITVLGSATPLRNADGSIRGALGAFIDVTERRRMIEALAERERELRQTLETAATGLTRIDRNLHYVMANSAYARIAGLPREQIVGRSMLDVLGPAALERARAYIERVLRGETVEYELELPWAAAGPGWIHAIYTPWITANGEVDGWVASINDITARKRTQSALEEREEQLRLATDAAEIGLWDLDLLNDRLYWPPRVKAMFGISAQVPVSMADFHAGLHPQDRERVSAAFAAATDPARRALYDVEYRTIGKEDGVVRWVAAKGRGIFDPDGRCVRLIGTTVHITARKRAEMALEESSRQKDEFLAMLAHELRNPLAAIGNAGELLERLAGNESRIERPLSMLKRQTHQLTRLVDDLLDVARIARGRIQLERTALEVEGLLEQSIELVQPLLREKGHRLTLRGSTAPLHVMGDRARLVQAISNVLHNAAKYTEAAGEIAVTVRAGDEQVEIEISDDGPGIAPDLLPRIFDLFVQSERTLDRAQGGLGIGLSVVKGLIEMHDGSVQAASAGTGQGARFTIRLPRIPQPGAVPSPQPTAGGPRARRVLVVDDNRDAADSLKMLLDMDGHEVCAVYDGQQALEAAARLRPEIILLDIGLPQMDGYQVAQEIRISTGHARPPTIIAVTGYGQSEDRRRSQAAGFDGHLVKPVDPAELRRSLAALA